MKIEYKTKKGTILFVKVPEDAYEFRVSTNLFYESTSENSELISYPRCKKLPEGNWQLIALTNDITEEQAKVMVDNLDGYGLMFKDANGRSGHKYALSAFKSIMQHLQLSEGKWIVLFKPN